MPNYTVVVTFMNGPADGRSVITHSSHVSIGQGADNDVAIDFDPAVVSKHLEIVHQEDQWLLVAHDGASGVQLNGTRIYGRVALVSDSLVRLGDTQLKVIVNRTEER